MAPLASFLGGVEIENQFDSFVGSGGTSTATVSLGATVTFGNLDIAALGVNNGTGTLTVTDTDSQVNIDGASYLHVGKNTGGGTAEVHVLNNGALVMGTGEIVVGSTGLISVDNGSLTTSGNNTVDGTMAVSNGGVVSNANGFIASTAGSTAEVTVTGTDSTWNHSADLFLGGTSNAAGGTGTLNVESGGAVNIDDTLVIWDQGDGEPNRRDDHARWHPIQRLDVQFQLRRTALHQ